MESVAAEDAPADVSPPRRASRLRGTLVSTFRRLMRLYFRDIERVGEPPGPDTRGRVVVSNHTNALIDPILVLTDAACEISPVAKSTLWSIPGLRWLLDRAGAVPIVRRKDTPDKDASANAATFDRIAQHLAGGGNLLIFPEGTSHSAPQLAPLRTGAARMLLAAEQLRGEAPTFQAAALEFDARTDFRSRCLVLWGPVRRFADVAGDGEERVRAATALMDADLRDLLVEGDTHEERLRVARVAELIAHDEHDRSLGRWSGIGREVELANRALRTVDPEVIARVAERVDAYYAELDRLGLEDAQVVTGARTRVSERDTEPRWVRAALAPLAASGVVLYALPYFIPRLVARSQDPDAVSTIKLGAALLVYPLWMGGLVAGSLALLPPPLSFAAAAVAIASPFAALRWLDAWYLRGREATPEQLARLARMRAAARVAIDEARTKLPS
ncbi:MAG: 1-acyl-sn-glycerol-3-phosphate acyltransferase [Deltaproteobacteria bacterium]|nr:1-acyl-sn-glycerol-3-phosphate acyltransferase [Deltaproteobacteria bacterium]